MESVPTSITESTYTTVIIVGAILGALGLVALFVAHRISRWRSPTGREGMVGEPGVAETAVDARGGSVMVRGELWSAVSERPIAAGAQVRVVGIDRLTLRVEPAKGDT